MKRAITETLVALLIVSGVIWVAHKTPHARHEATVDHATIEATR
jgi:hypothetical protein